MNYQKLFCKPIPSISTPFLADGNVDYAMLEVMIEQYLAWGHDVLMLTAGDSNFACMSDAEIAQVTFAVLKQAGSRAAVIVADRYFATNAALEFAEETAKRGAACYMALPPDWGASVMPDELIAHYRAIGKIIPVMAVTNIFSPRGPMGFGMTVCEKLLEVPEVVAVKDDVCGEFGRKMYDLLAGSKAMISGGQKQNHFDLAAYGETGHLTTFGRFMPEVSEAYWKLYHAGDLNKAMEIIKQIDMPYFDLICGFRGGFNAGIYGSLELAGVAKRFRREPYATITGEDMEKLQAFHAKVPGILQQII